MSGVWCAMWVYSANHLSDSICCELLSVWAMDQQLQVLRLAGTHLVPNSGQGSVLVCLMGSPPGWQYPSQIVRICWRSQRIKNIKRKPFTGNSWFSNRIANSPMPNPLRVRLRRENRWMTFQNVGIIQTIWALISTLVTAIRSP